MSQKLKQDRSISDSFLSADILHHQLKNGFRFGIPELDNIVQLYPGSITLIQGEIPQSVSRTLITQLLVSLLTNNSGMDLVFIDGTCTFPYYEISFEARRYGLNPYSILNRIQLARAFNYHQITEILIQKLPQLIEENENIRMIFLPHISSLHLSNEALKNLEYDKLTATSAIVELNQAIGKLKSLTIQYDLIGVMTAEGAPKSQKPLGGTFLAHAATDVIRVKIVNSLNKSSKGYELVFDVQKGGPPVRASLTHQQAKTKQTSLNQFW